MLQLLAGLNQTESFFFFFFTDKEYYPSVNTTVTLKNLSFAFGYLAMSVKYTIVFGYM